MAEGAQEDYARLEIQTPLAREVLAELVADPIALLRINPLLEFQEVRVQGPDHWHLVLKHLGRDRLFELDARRQPLADGGWRLSWSGWLKQATEVHLEEGPEGARLVLIDDYSGLDEQTRKARLDEVDNSLNHWGHALYRYFRNWKRWSWLPGWKWYFRGPWLKMKPSARRISFMLLVVTAMEFVLFLFAIVILKLELHS